MKQALLKWSGGHSKIAGAALLSALISACGTPQPGETSSSVSSSQVSSIPSSAAASSSSQPPVVVQEVSFQDMCEIGFDPHITDGSLPDEPDQYTNGSGQTDAVVRPEIIEWMEQHEWQESHALWHDVRRCGGFGFPGFGGGSVDVCSFTEMLPEENECRGPQDGYEFLVMHRHMINTLKSLWPTLDDQFAGFDGWPSREDYPEYLRQYYSDWNQQVLASAQAADDIPNMTREEVLQRWPTEGVFGQWIQCGSTTGGLGGNGIHGALHFNAFPPQNQDHSIANPRRNLDAYIFWKLHGYIDNAWEAYRQKVGKTDEDPELKAELVKQCREHHFWSEQIKPSLVNYDQREVPVDGGSSSSSGSGTQDGYFANIVKPALQGCLGCHGSSGLGGLVLDGPSDQVVSSLVNVDSQGAQGYKLVVPYDPDNSWLYIKASAMRNGTVSVNATCNNGPGACLGGMKLEASSNVDAVIRQWILDGAPVD